MEALVPLIALLLDGIVGDPRTRFHPVVLLGNLIALLEKLLYRAAWGKVWQLFAGALLAATVTATVYSLLFFIENWLQQQNTGISFFITALLLSFVITPRSLAEAGLEIAAYLKAQDMEKARFKVGWIVGRDTQSLDESEVTRATVETVAENIVDGIISPLFFFCLGGLPLAFAYRAVNTMDSMIGYKNDAYLYFGRFAARLDDVCNWIPARITFLLVLFAAFILGYDWRSAWLTAQRDAAKHPSPNSGWAEASVAGALKVRLGGLNYYGGRESFRAYMGEPLQKLAASHIKKTVKVMYAVSLLGAIAASAALFRF